MISSQPKQMAVALVCDERLATQAGAVAFKINTDWNFDVHIFVETNSGRNEDFLRVEREGITYHVNRLLNGFRGILPEMKRYPIAVWGRILLPCVMSDYKRILYVDVDILPGPKPTDLLKLKLPHGIGMVSNYWTRFHERIEHQRTIEHMRYLRLTAADYFNAGVILMEPSKLNTDDVGNALRVFVTNFGDKIRSADQDFLAYHYKGKITQLSAHLNFIQPLMGFGLEGSATPSIRHYVMQPKLYEKLYRYGANSIIKSAQTEFVKLLENARLPTDMLTPKQKPKFSRRAKTFVRSTIANTFLGTSRRNKEYAKWRDTRSIMLTLLQEDLDRCADQLPFQIHETEPKLSWTGSEFICLTPK